MHGSNSTANTEFPRRSPGKGQRSRRAAAGLPILALILATGLAIPGVSAQTEAEAAILTLYVDGSRIGDVEVRVRAGEVEIPMPAVSDAILPLVDDSVYVIFRSTRRPDEDISTADLRILGFDVVFDESALALRIRIPARFMRLGYLGSGNPPPPTKAPGADPSAFSAFLNGAVRGNSAISSAGTSSLSFSADADGAANFRGWVAEASATAAIEPAETQAAPPSAELRHARIVRDFRGLESRLQAGTVDLPWTGRQSRLPALGAVAIRYKDAALPASPAEGDRRSVSDTFIVEEPTLVTVRLNGASVYSSRIGPGRYRIADLPFASGINDVEIEIAETGKEVLRWRIGVPWDGSALRAGDFDYGVGVGVDEEDAALPLFSGFAEFVLLDSINAGVSAQSAYGSRLVSLALSATTGIGLFALDGALSWGDGSFGGPTESGFALGLSYRLSFPGRRLLPRFGFGMDWRNPDFAPPKKIHGTVQSDPAWRASAQVVQIVPIGASISLAGDYGDNGEGERTFALALVAAVPLRSGATITASAGLDDKEGMIRPSLNVSILVMPALARNTFRYRQNLVSGESSVDFSAAAGKGPGALTAAASLENPAGSAEAPLSLSANVKRTGKLVDLSAASTVRRDFAAGVDTATASFGADAALVFAEGILAPSRRVGDSFALLVPSASFGGERLEMRLGAQSVTAAGPKGAAAIASLSAYKNVVAGIEAPYSQPDVTPRDPQVELRPTYKSGIVVRPERLSSVYVSGRLTGRDGKPRAWLLGAAEDRSGRSFGELFTDEDGRFELYNLEPGAYVIEWLDGDLEATVFEIPEDASGVLDLGEVGSGGGTP